MELLVILTGLLAAFSALGVLAVSFGADSRDGMADDWSRRVSR